MARWTVVILALALYPTLLYPQTGDSKPSPRAPVIHASCILTNHPTIVSHYDKENQKLDEQEIEDWVLECSIAKDGSKRVLRFCSYLCKPEPDGDLGAVLGIPIPHPTTYLDAVGAAREFVKQAPKIERDWRKK